MVIARELTRALRDAGHHASILVTPQNRFGRQASAYLATWLTDVASTEGHPIDQVITLRYPSYAVRHPRHVCWLNHTMREYYDLWPQFSVTLSPRGLMKERVRRAAIRATDRYLLSKNVTKLFVQSRTIQQRLSMWPELTSTVLYPPAPQRGYRCDGYGDYVFMVSRLTPLKRADLLIEALATADGQGIRAAIAGEGEDQQRLEALIGRLQRELVAAVGEPLVPVVEPLEIELQVRIRLRLLGVLSQADGWSDRCRFAAVDALVALFLFLAGPELGVFER